MTTKKIRLLDEESIDVTSKTAVGSALTREDIDKLLEFAEKIDWKLWELLKVAKSLSSELP
jgi:hypothetical protein